MYTIVTTFKAVSKSLKVVGVKLEPFILENIMEEYLRTPARRMSRISIDYDVRLAAVENYIAICQRRLDAFAKLGAQYACRRETQRINRAEFQLRILRAQGERR